MLGNQLYNMGGLALLGLKRKHIRGFFFYSLFVLYFILIPAGDLVFDVKIEFFGAAVIIIPSFS